MFLPEDDYSRWDAVEMARLVRDRQVSATDLAQTARALLDRWSGLNAVAYVADDPGGDLPSVGSLAGVPFAVKELLAWPGLPWAIGSRLLAGNLAPGLSPYAARLMDAGLNVICSTTSSEFGLLGSTETALHGITVNPWGAGLSAGGSSGGSAALVAAGIVPMAHGSDAGGSLRVPAALNGLFGFKPSNRRCPPTGPDASGLSALVVEHVMSRTVRDSAHVLAATERTGTDAVHPPVGLILAPTGAALRIGLLTPTLMGRAPDPLVQRELDRAAALCAALGHDVDLVAAPRVDGEVFSRAFFAAAAMTLTQVAQMATTMLGRAPGPQELEPFTLELIDWATTLGPHAQPDSERAIADAARAYLHLFERHDVVLSPTLAVPSWPIGHLAPSVGRETLIRRTEEMVGYTPVHNAAGCPAMSVPLGGHDGLPIGIHFAAAPGADGLLLSLAYALEEASPWADARPQPARFARTV
jgi:amidase